MSEKKLVVICTIPELSCMRCENGTDLPIYTDARGYSRRFCTDANVGLVLHAKAKIGYLMDSEISKRTLEENRHNECIFASLVRLDCM